MIRRRSLRGWIGNQSTILFRQKSEKFRTTNGMKGRKSTILMAIGENVLTASAYSDGLLESRVLNVYPNAA